MKFSYLLFDADDTLFDFPKAAARAFSAMCRSNGVPDTLDTRALYHRINQELWAAFDRGEVSKDYVTLERFVRFFQALKLPRDPDKCNRDYLTALGAGVYPLPHAEAVCRELVRRGHKLYIVTSYNTCQCRHSIDFSILFAIVLFILYFQSSDRQLFCGNICRGTLRLTIQYIVCCRRTIQCKSGKRYLLIRTNVFVLIRSLSCHNHKIFTIIIV